MLLQHTQLKHTRLLTLDVRSNLVKPGQRPQSKMRSPVANVFHTTVPTRYSAMATCHTCERMQIRSDQIRPDHLRSRKVGSDGVRWGKLGQVILKKSS